MKNIILIAPAQAGKGTQAELIKEKYGIPHISMGALLRDARKRDDEVGRHIVEAQDKGILCDDSITVRALKSRLSEVDCNNGYILEGFPRTKVQLDLYNILLGDLNKDFGVAISLEVSYEELLNRFMSRINCPKCEAIYNSSYEKMKPEVEGICDICGTSLVRRSDDTLEAFKIRYQIYLSNISELFDEFEKMEVLHHVDANRDIDVIFAEIEAILND